MRIPFLWMVRDIAAPLLSQKRVCGILEKGTYGRAVDPLKGQVVVLLSANKTPFGVPCLPTLSGWIHLLERLVFPLVSGSDPTLPRLWARFHLHRRRARILCEPRVEQCPVALPGMPRRAQSIEWWQLWRWRRRWFVSARRAPDVRRRLCELWPAHACAVPAARRPPGVLQRVLRAAGRRQPPFRALLSFTP
jgi:hypothetical protein